MPIDIREDLTKGEIKVTEAATPSLNLSLESSLTVINEGLHAIATKNFNRYQPQSLKNSVPSWTSPYLKPVIMHHNEYDGKTIGRIQSVEYVTKDTRSGTPALRFTLSIGDWDGQNQITDGRLLTTSVGITATDCKCSICGQNIAEERCDHERGQVYDNQICYWDIYEFEGKELSYVITPSDPFAANIQIVSNKPGMGQVNVKSSLLEGVNISQPAANTTTTIVEQKMELNNIEQPKVTEVNVTESVTETPPTTDPPVTEPIVTEATQNPPVSVTVTEAQTEPPAIVNDQTNTIKELQSQLTVEKQLREQLENTYNNVLIKYKKELSEKLNGLRKASGKVELEESVLLARSIDSLSDSIADEKIVSPVSISTATVIETQITTPQKLVESVPAIENPAIVVPLDNKSTVVENQTHKTKTKKPIIALEGVVDSLFHEME